MGTPSESAETSTWGGRGRVLSGTAGRAPDWSTPYGHEVARTIPQQRPPLRPDRGAFVHPRKGAVNSLRHSLRHLRLVALAQPVVQPTSEHENGDWLHSLRSLRHQNGH